MQFLQKETVFTSYYDKDFIFPYNKSDTIPQWMLEPKVFSSDYQRQKKKMRRKPKTDSTTEKNVDGSKEMWIKSGALNGAWRPRQIIGPEN